MRLVKLEDIIKIQIGKTPQRDTKEYWGEGYPWVSIADLKTRTILKTKEQITKLAVNECGCKLIPKGTLLMSFKLSIGKLAFAGMDLFTNEAICGLTILNKHKVYPDFLFYALKNTNLLGSNVAVMGATLNTKSLNELKIPIPETLAKQIQIATILGQAEKLIAQRKQSIALLDEFLKSTFLEMFGDPVRNEKGWEKVILENVIDDIIAGSSYGGEMKGFLEENELGVLKTSAVTWGTFNPNEYKAVQKKLITKKLIHPKKGDLLFSRANTRELVGATCIVLDDFPNLFLPDKIWKIQLVKEKIIQYYLHYLLQDKSFKTTLTNDATGSHGSMLNISMSTLRLLICPLPPLELQTQFAQVVEKTEALKTQYKASLQELENLFGSHSQKAFKGELVMPKVYAIDEPALSVAAEPEPEYGKARKKKLEY